ncbi:MAG: hypothetical protein H6825_04030 [Planctomycetes bacterium]|nr:hypothetical protein [Planctomycetota bacterium]
MKPRRRILVVELPETPRGLRMATSEADQGLPPRDVALLAARLLTLGAEVRVMDMHGEQLKPQVVRRELALWRPDLVLLRGGGGDLSDDPVPDERPLATLLSGWSWRAPVLLAGPLGRHYGVELMARHPRLVGVLAGPVTTALLDDIEPASTPGVAVPRGAELAVTSAEAGDEPDALPAWHALPLDAYASVRPNGLRAVGIGPLRESLSRTLVEVRHAVHRAGARSLVFEDRDLGRDADLASELARAMFGAAPGIPWTARLRADSVTPSFVLALANGGCREVMIASPSEDDVPAESPMDDRARPRLESAVEAVRVTGMGVAVEHVIGRPGHDRAILAAWQRWFADRSIAVRARVRVLHAGARGPGEPAIEEARKRAGCWDNELQPADVEKAVRMVTAGRPAHAGRR